MRKFIILILCAISLGMFSQSPNLINYQAIARDASGTIIASANIGLKFKIIQGTPTGSVSYEETNTATSSSSGIFTVAIGAGTPVSGSMSTVDWANGPYYIEVSVDPAGGTSYSVVGVSQLLSVPYALYAAKAGGGSAMPTGTTTGQTMYWNQLGNKWEVDNNLSNNGNKVTIGDPFITNNKLKVVSYSGADSSAILAYKANSNGNAAAVRGIASGNSANSGSITINPIMGGHFVGYNGNNSGTALGVLSQGTSPSGDAVGLVAIGSSSSTASGISVGLYATAVGTNTYNSYAAIFEKGKVIIRDSLQYDIAGSVGDVLVRGVGGKAYWGAGGAGPWVRNLISGSQNVQFNTNSDLLNIGLPSGISANEKVHIHNTSGDAYINLSTSSNFGRVGLVFGESTNWSHAFMSFDNSNNNLSYRVGGKLVLNHEGNIGSLHLGKVPPSASSLSKLVVYDSVLTAGSRPILKLVNLSGSGTGPAGMFLGEGTGSGVGLGYIKLGVQEYFRISDPSLVTNHYFTFKKTGEFYPGSDGVATGLGFIKGGPGATNDLIVSGPSQASIVFDGHLKAAGPTPTVSVSTSGTNLTSFPFTATLTGGNNNDIKGSLRAVNTFSLVFQMYSSSSDELSMTVLFNRPYANPPTVVVSPKNDIMGLTYFTTIMAGNAGFVIHVRNQSNSGVPVNTATPFEFNYIVIE
ncbi:MAG: hypothetical protein J0L69_10855 [Bacteroidetes bacterium]|nr:hypothetical protein [Bacteroidota bacterium]